MKHTRYLHARRSLNAEEKELIWRFRWSLTSEPRALTKFLACVDWGDILVRTPVTLPPMSSHP